MISTTVTNNLHYGILQIYTLYTKEAQKQKDNKKECQFNNEKRDDGIKKKIRKEKNGSIKTEDETKRKEEMHKKCGDYQDMLTWQ